MTKTEKIEFVQQLTNHIANEITSLIVRDKLPGIWDGIELRQLLADKFAASTWKEAGGRLKAYRNETVVRNLI